MTGYSSYDSFLFFIVAGVFVIAVLAIVVLAVARVLAIAISAVARVLANPFYYPYFIEQFDVSRKRSADIQDYVDRFLSDRDNRRALRAHRQRIENWKATQEKYLETCLLQKRRRRQYLETLDDGRAYRFQAVRNQTRYRQHNYVKTSYAVSVYDDELAVNWEWLSERNKRLAAIGYEATLKEYHAKNQRRLVTQKLRQQIMERDNYTCQICGKYMPDEVGLHIDHIVPVAKGGKTVPSNLQVLCSKCNGSKGAKTRRRGLIQ